MKLPLCDPISAMAVLLLLNNFNSNSTLFSYFHGNECNGVIGANNQ